MRALIKNSNIPYNPKRHEYDIVDGKKVYKEFPVRYWYLDKYGFLHVTKWEDIACKYGMGHYIKSDERLVNDIPLTVSGADNERLYLGKGKTPVVHTSGYTDAYSYEFGKTYDNDYCKFLAGIYMELQESFS